MDTESLAAAPAREHHEIDAGAAAFTAAGELPEGRVRASARPVTPDAGR